MPKTRNSDTIQIPPQRMERSLWERIKRQAKREHRSAASLVRVACERYLEASAECERVMRQQHISS